MKNKTKDIVMCAVFAAIICVCSVISLPIWVIPVSLGTFGIMLASSTLGIKRGFISTGIFVLLGIIGLPVFSGFQGGAGVLTSPTGGFVIGYIFMPLIAGINIRTKGRFADVSIRALCNMGAAVVCYIFGMAQFINLTGFSVPIAFATCVAPFILFDIIKAIGAAWIAESIRKKVLFS